MQGVAPDFVALKVVLQSCCGAGEWEAALRVWERIAGGGGGGAEEADTDAFNLALSAAAHLGLVLPPPPSPPALLRSLLCRRHCAQLLALQERG